MKTNQVTGMIGSAMLIIGMFVPVIDFWIESPSLIELEKIILIPILVIILAIFAFFMAYGGHPGLPIVALLSLLLLIIASFYLMYELGDYWYDYIIWEGCAVPAVGIFLLLISGNVDSRAITKDFTSTKPDTPPLPGEKEICPFCKELSTRSESICDICGKTKR